MNLPVFDCLIDENLNDESGIYAISFVDVPATEIDFVALSSQSPKKEFLCRNGQKQLLTGVVLRPDQLIYRNDKQRGEYYIKFGAAEIEKIARKMMKTGIALSNTTHQHQNPLSGNYLTELWIVEDPQHDKSVALGFQPQPKGTLMCSYKIEDKQYWDMEVMTGNVRGFSLEGFFFQQTTDSINNKYIKQKMNKSNYKKERSFLSKLKSLFLDISAVEKNDVTASGSVYLIFSLADGKQVYIDADGFVTLEGEQMPAGEHPLSDGNILVVDAEGQFVETKEVSEKVSDPDEATAPQVLSSDKKEEETGEETVESLKAKVAELESKLSEIASLAQEADAELQKLRGVTPSALPATAGSPKRNPASMERHEQMAYALSQTIKSRKKNIK